MTEYAALIVRTERDKTIQKRVDENLIWKNLIIRNNQIAGKDCVENASKINWKAIMEDNNLITKSILS